MAKQKDNTNDGVDMEPAEGGLLIDLTNVEEDAGFEVLPRGIYDCVVSNLSFEYSQASGNPMWTWELEVEEGEFASRKLFTHTVFKGAGLGRTKRTISRVAPELLEAAFDPEEIADKGTMLGKRCRARVDVKPYEGQPRNNVKDVLPAQGGSSEGFLG